MRRLFGIVVVVLIIFGVPSSAFAQTVFQYGSCNDGVYVYYEDWTLGSTYIVTGGWGQWVDGSGFEFVTYGGGHDSPQSSQLDTGTSPVSNAVKTAGYIWTDGDSIDIYPWSYNDVPIASSPFYFTGIPTSIMPIFLISIQQSGLHYSTAILLQGTYTGTCPVASLDPLPDGIGLDVRPLRDDVTYEVIHVDGYGPMVDDVHTDRGVNVYNSFAGTVVAIEDAGSGYLVKVLADDDRYTIYSNLDSVYPRLNDTIETGCVLGTAADSFKAPTSGPYTQDPGLLWYYSGTDFYDFNTNEYIDWQTEFYQPPVNAEPCGSDLRTDHCINYNPGLDERASGWITLNVEDAYIIDGSVKLQEYNSSLSQYIVLDHEVDNYVTVSTRTYWDYDYIAVTVIGATDYELLDTQVITLDLNDLGVDLGDLVVTEIGPLDLSTYDVNDTYIITVIAMFQYTNGVWIEDVCVSTGDAVVGIGHCYFDDWALEDNAQWTTHAGADWDSNPSTFGTGVVLGPGEWISGPVSLPSYETEDVDYTLTLMGKVTGIDIGDLTEIFGGWSVTVSQEVLDGVTVELDIGDTTVDNALVVLSTPTDFTVPMDTTIIGDLTITNDSGNTKNLYLDAICIEPNTGVWPGTEDPDVPGAGDGRVCDTCPMPTGLSLVEIPAWLVWLWCSLSNFLYCTLISWIVALWDKLSAAAGFIGLFGRYLAVLMAQLTGWMMSLLTALGLALKEAMLYVISLAWNSMAGLGIIKLLYDVIGYLIAFLLGMAEIGQTAVAYLLSLLQMIINVGVVVSVFISSLSGALSGDVATITVPSCAPASSPLYEGFCLVFTFVDAVFDELPALATGMLLNAGLLGFVTIIWTIRQFGSSIVNV